MDKMKKFFKYFLILAIVYVIVNISSFFVLKSTYNTKEYTISESVLNIEVTEAKATFVNGYVKGLVKNNTDSVISNKYIKLDAFSKRDVLLGTKYVKINDLYPGQKTDFESSFNYEQVDNIKVSTIDVNEIEEGTLDFNFDNPDDVKISWAIIFGAFILLVSNNFMWVLL